VAGQRKPRTRAEEFVARLEEADPAVIPQLRAALAELDGKPDGSSAKIMVKPAGVAVMKRYSYLMRRHWTHRVVGAAMAAPRERRVPRRRHRRAGARRAAGCRSGQDPGDPDLPEQPLTIGGATPAQQIGGGGWDRR
jgi:hypothetical protein